jgi:nucleoside-diphosphate-sugar epimerase
MRALFIGGTGNISTSVSRLALRRGWELYLLNRGQHEVNIEGAQVLKGDIHNPTDAQVALAGLNFDCVVDWIAYTPQDIENDLNLFRGRTRQFIFISTASVYQKPPTHPLITESTPLYNPYWKYSQNKIACEERLNQAYRQEDFPAVIVRPSLTYDTHFPIAIGGWGCYTLADRLLKGKPIVVHGDGSSLWTVTHSEDFAKGFVGLMGNPQVTGHAFHITSDELLTWNQIYTTIAEALGVEAKLVHIASERIHQINPGLGAGLLGDKAWSAIFDNRKIKTFVPEYQATIPFWEGIRRTLRWFDERPERKWVNEKVNEEVEEILSKMETRPSGRGS